MGTQRERRAGFVSVSAVLVVGALATAMAGDRFHEAFLPSMLERYNLAVEKGDLAEMEQVARLITIVHPDRVYGDAMRSACDLLQAARPREFMPREDCFVAPRVKRKTGVIADRPERAGRASKAVDFNAQQP